MRRYLTFIVGSVLGCIITLLFQISQNVQKYEDSLTEINSQIMQEREKISVFKSEWAYLIRPQRLQKMAEAYTRLIPQTGGVRVPIKDIPYPDEVTASAENKNEKEIKVSISAKDYFYEASDTDTDRLNRFLKKASRRNSEQSAGYISVSFKDVWGGKQR